ncbi:MAG: hypothetical protein ABSE80_02295 [Halobacteriota archaeon]|jgi:hypothetical protein
MFFSLVRVKDSKKTPTKIVIDRLSGAPTFTGADTPLAAVKAQRTT